MNSPLTWFQRPKVNVGTLLLLSLLILMPRLLQPDFGLLDDGRTLSVASQITRGEGQVDFDRDAGRFRPVYWAYNALLYRLAGANPRGWFLGNLVLLGAAVWLLYRWVSLRSSQPLVGLGAGVLFLFSGPVVESFYTLSKSEPLQVALILGALNLLDTVPAHGLRRWGWRAAATALLLFLAAGVKETTLVMIPIGLGRAGLAWGLHRTASARDGAVGAEAGGDQPAGGWVVLSPAPSNHPHTTDRRHLHRCLCVKRLGDHRLAHPLGRLVVAR